MALRTAQGPSRPASWPGLEARGGDAPGSGVSAAGRTGCTGGAAGKAPSAAGRACGRFITRGPLPAGGSRQACPLPLSLSSPSRCSPRHQILIRHVPIKINDAPWHGGLAGLQLLPPCVPWRVRRGAGTANTAQERPATAEKTGWQRDKGCPGPAIWICALCLARRGGRGDPLSSKQGHASTAQGGVQRVHTPMHGECQGSGAPQCWACHGPSRDRPHPEAFHPPLGAPGLRPQSP